jgi:ABC-type multidrug transport system ATPase subunit
MIEVRNLGRSFKNKPILKNINLSFSPGDFIYLEGQNGAGKTTFLKILSSLLHPDAGGVFLNGTSIFSIAEKWKHKVSYVSADDNVFLPQLTGMQNIILFNSFFGIPELQTREKLKEISTIFPLGNSVEIKYGLCSSGMKQKLKLAFAFSRNSDIYLLDEPVSSLDSETRKQFLNLVEAHKKNRIFIFTEHGEAKLKSLATQSYRLREGSLC